MTRIVLKKRRDSRLFNFSKYEIRRDLCRNAHLIPEENEPTFIDTFKIPVGAQTVQVKTKRCRILLEFI